MSSTKRQQILDLAERQPIVRPADVTALGISTAYLSKLHADGSLKRLGRGLYALATGVLPGEHASLLEACSKVPKGVICLLSALRFHDLTTQNPFEVWMAIGEKARAPRIDTPQLRLARFATGPLHFGVETHHLHQIRVRVYSPAKTVADCFKYRNKIGLDVAIEALRDCWRQKKATSDALWQAAEVCRMRNVMRPYMESLV